MKKHLPLLTIFICCFVLMPKSVFAATAPTINEFIAHPSNSVEWVEFYNPDHIDLSTYYIDDDTDFTSDVGSSAKKSLQNINTTNPTYPYIELSSMLNNDGDHVVLFDSSGNVVDQYSYTSDPGVDISIGRFPDGIGTFQLLLSATKGNANSSGLPTATPTPTDAPTPTPTPKVPTATPTPRPTVTPTPKPTIKIASLTPTTDPQEATNDQSVLAAEITPTNIPSPTPTTAVLGATAKPNIIAIIFYSFGGILFTICGILLFRQYKLSKSHESTRN